MTKEFVKSIKFLIIGVAVVVGANFVYAWNGPTGAPSTTTNADLPLTVGSARQTKGAGLNLGGTLSVNKATDPQTGSVLDVDGVIMSKGHLVLGGESIMPSVDGYGLQVLNSAATQSILSVDTRTPFEGIQTKRLRAEEDVNLDKSLSVNNDLTVDADTSTSTLLVGKTAYVGDSLYVGTTAPDSMQDDLNNAKATSYDFFLNGTTNIGIPVYGGGGQCTMTYTEMGTQGKQCPLGTYLSRISGSTSNPNVDTYAECSSFSPSTYLTGSCYGFKPLVTHISYLWDSNSGNTCGVEMHATVSVTKNGSGVDQNGAGGLTYAWEAKLDNGNWVTPSTDYLMGTPPKIRGNGDCGNTASCKVYFGVRQDTQHQVALRVRVKDSDGTESWNQVSKNFSRKYFCGI